MRCWEYQVERIPSAERLNVLGLLGWELVAVVASGSGMDYTAFLKRPLDVEHIGVDFKDEAANTSASSSVQ